jgi:hypothetical protein
MPDKLFPWLQLLRWGKKRTRGLPPIEVTISSKQDLTGLLAALAVLYHDEELFKQVSQRDMVAAVVYGDQLAIPRAVELGMQLLEQAARTTRGCTMQCKALSAMPIWPTCLLPLLPVLAAQHARVSGCTAEQQKVYEGMLVSALGNLEAVWGDQELEGLLLALPLPAAELLLSSDHLRVVSEDTVLYTALRYVEHIDSIQARPAAKVALSKCIRCVRLSQRNLLAHATTAGSPLFSKEQQELLLSVLSLCLVSEEHCLAVMSKPSRVDKVPKAWLLPARAHLVPPSPVSLTWKVPVEDIKAAVWKATRSKKAQTLHSKTVTGPLQGAAFGLSISVRPQLDTAGVVLDYWMTCQQFRGPFISAEFTVTATPPVIHRSTRAVTGRSHGWSSVLTVQPIKGDRWDDAAWAAKGLPSTGHLELRLTAKPL